MPTVSASIRIGYCLSLTGPVAGKTRSARLAHDIWREDINRRGGLLGRPVEFVCYDGHFRTLGSGRFRAVYRAVDKFKDGRLHRRYHFSSDLRISSTGSAD
jgi:Periplasmic binding protein